VENDDREISLCINKNNVPKIFNIEREKMNHKSRFFLIVFFKLVKMPIFRTLLAAGLWATYLMRPIPTTAQISQIQTEQDKYCPTWASSPLPEARQGQPYSASLGSNIGELTAIQEIPIFPAIPEGLSLVGTKVQGTPTSAGQYTIEVQDTSYYPCSGFGPVTSGGKIIYQMRKSFDLKILDTQPPQLSVFSVNPSTVSASGDNVTVLVKAADNVGVTRVMLTVLQPNGHQGSTLMKGTTTNNPMGDSSGEWQQVIALAMNTQETPVVYTFTLNIQDADGNVTKAGPVTATVSAHADRMQLSQSTSTPIGQADIIGLWVVMQGTEKNHHIYMYQEGGKISGVWDDRFMITGAMNGNVYTGKYYTTVNPNGNAVTMTLSPDGLNLEGIYHSSIKDHTLQAVKDVEKTAQIKASPTMDTPSPGFAGTWGTTEGNIVLNVDGTKVSGTWGDKTIGGTVKGNVLNGRYYKTSAPELLWDFNITMKQDGKTCTLFHTKQGGGLINTWRK
jgi:hypothetical protein